MSSSGNRKVGMRTGKWTGLLENIFIVVLTFYPLRHVFTGGDLWDTGYNYANFQYMGTEHMDSMWLFSTYLANVTGNFLTKLPGAGSLVGMNFYTGLFISALALLGYFFCTRKCNMPGWITFLGEMLAISLCWCPTALLYNYLTYLSFLISCILLYQGLIKDEKKLFIAAGVFLGANVLVRFSNLPEMAMIVAVWAYNIILWLEERGAQKKICTDNSSDDRSAKDMQSRAAVDSGEKCGNGFWPRLLRQTLWCLLGYVAALAVLFLFIQLRYGLDDYVAGIQRLFAMTDNATDYKPTSMIMGLVGAYVENMYWAARFAVIVLGGVLAFAAGNFAGKLSRKGKTIWTIAGIIITAVVFTVKTYYKLESALDPLFGQPILFSFLFELDGLFLILLMLCAVFGWMKRVPGVLWGIAMVNVIGWLYYRQFTSWSFFSYDSMLRPAILFMMLTMLIAVIRIFHKNSPKEEKLLSGMLILIILLTSLGSNNGVYPSINNLFLAAPYTLWQIWRFVKNVGTRPISCDKLKAELIIDAFPVKGFLIAFLAMCLFQCGMFGTKFVFAEATGVQNATAQVENNEVLKKVNMSPDKAQWLAEITAYADRENLQGSEVILYGNIPSLSYYLQMPSAFNPWSDLASYSDMTMRNELQEIAGELSMKWRQKPVVILENKYALYEESVAAGADMTGATLSDAEREKFDKDNKLQLLLKYMEEQGYEQTFRNEKFAVYR